jgi:succinate dehydrogenase / fumarate reductase, cytochrome b subunit
MNWFVKMLNSSLGLKYVMGLTGVALLGFVLMHMIGNLAVFSGEEALNNYAAFLHSDMMKKPLWIARIGLLVIFTVHIGAALKLNAINQNARDRGYRVQETIQASFASRYMVMTGLVVLAFVVLHLAHFTLKIGPWAEFADLKTAKGGANVYAMVIAGFKGHATGIPMALIYVACNLLLALHISHGASSLFQSLGVNHPRYQPLFRSLGPLLGVTIAVGNLAIPLAVMFRLLPAIQVN